MLRRSAAFRDLHYHGRRIRDREIIARLARRKDASDRIRLPPVRIRRTLQHGAVMEIKLAALDAVADRVGPRGEEENDRRDRDPGHLLPVPSLQNEVVDRNEQKNITEEENPDRLEAGRFRRLNACERI